MTLWTASEAAEATGARAQGDWVASGVSIDTRALQPGDLFVALTAARDGHDFVARALEKGAAAALVSRVPEGVPADAPLLIAENVQTALEALGAAARARTGARVVAVTGSVGKTSTKEMLAVMLADQGRTHASVASYNNHWGVPLTLARMPRDTDFAVIEIGMNHPGEIAPLARLARPHVALVTTVGPAHLEAFGTITGIAREKASVMQGLEPGGIGVLNADIDQARVLTDTAQELGVSYVTFGGRSPDFRLSGAVVQGGRTTVEICAKQKDLRFSLQTEGLHFAMNALGALAACAALGADIDRAAESLSAWSPVKGRGARERVVLNTDGDTLELLDDSYNANPTSMAAALNVLAGATPHKGQRIAFLGDMKELGPDERDLHAGLAALPALAAIDTVHCIGPLMQALHEALPPDRRGDWTETSDEMCERLQTRIGAGDIVLVKGSLSMNLARIVDAIGKIGHGDAPSR